MRVMSSILVLADRPGAARRRTLIEAGPAGIETASGVTAARRWRGGYGSLSGSGCGSLWAI